MNAVVTANGQVVIPAKLRYRLGIKKGTKLYVEERNGEIVLRPLTKEYFQKMCGILKSKTSMTQALIEERARDKEREETKFKKFGAR